MMTEIEKGIIEIVNGSGLTSTPSPQDPREYGGELVAARGAIEVASAIERACEQTIEKMYFSVEQNEAMVRDQRKKVDDFANVLRNYYKAHVGSLSEFMAHLQRTTDELDAHVKGFEDRLIVTHYPRAGDD
jgi:hypothetical protein